MSLRRIDPGPAEVVARDRSTTFRFDGRAVSALEGDTIGSALAAADVDVISKSFKYHRPRGLLCCAGRCPNCLVEVDGTPNVRACMTPVQDGMTVRSQNAWPSLRFDLLSMTDRFDRLLPVGFYYKTFIRPRRLWPLYERFLRRAAGLGRIDITAIPARHVVTRHVHVDVAVVGGGPAGCIAALEAAGAGARVVLVDDQDRLGGHLRIRSAAVDGDDRVAARSGHEAAEKVAALVAGEPLIEHLSDATAIGAYEGGLLAVSQGDTFVRVRARQLIVATGAAERPMLFDGNDRPGVMLASGILRLRHLYGVSAGERLVVVTDDDQGWRAAAELVAAGLAVIALADVREGEAGGPGWEILQAAGVGIHVGATIVGTRGRSRVTGLRLRTDAGTLALDCDTVAVAARREPQVGLLAQAGSVLRADGPAGELVARSLPADVHAVGDVLGARADGPDLTEAGAVGRDAAGRARTAAAAPWADAQAGARADAQAGASLAKAESPAAPARSTAPLGDAGGRKRFVCLCEDVTVKELEQGVAEGFADIETLKRYSTILMGPCQGKMCAALAAQVHDRILGSGPGASPPTTARPPIQPVSLAALAGPHLAPVRRTAMHERHASAGARWIDMGDWKRPLHYGDVEAECRAVREAAGIIDVSTLGKLDVEGPGAGAFLDWLHPNRFSDMSIGRVRYRAMLDDAAIVIDDGTVARLGDERFLVSTTTGNLDAVDQWLRWWLAGSDRDVSVTDVTSQYAAINLAGPRSRDVLARLTDADVSREAMPYLAAAECQVAGVPAIILRIGFVGELGYEIHVPADFGAHVWDSLMAAGGDDGLRPFGVEAQRVLRLEKGFPIIGQDTDALSDPVAAGMGALIKADKDDFIGREAALATLASVSGEAPLGSRQVLTGFETAGDVVPQEGAAIVREGRAVGRVTSARYSPTLGHPIGLAWLAADSATDGEPITIRTGVGAAGETIEGRVRQGAFYDPEGVRPRT
jgi:sarcosine oxidase subunit alpha